MNRPRIYRINNAVGNQRSRRKLLRQMASLSLGLPLSKSSVLPLLAKSAPQTKTTQPHERPAPPPAPTSLSPQDEQFLDELEHSCFLFFWEQSNPPTGLTKDRCNVRVKDNLHRRKTRLRQLCRSTLAGYPVSIVSVAQVAHTSRILLSLRQHQHRRKNVGLRGIICGYCDPLVRHPHLPSAFSRRNDLPTCPCHL
jgi:hypothetical protein